MRRANSVRMKLFTGVGGNAFVIVGVGLALLMLTVAMVTVPPHHGGTIGLARVLRPKSMPPATREDAMTIAVTRNGDVFFGNSRVQPDEIPVLIRDQLSHGSEAKIYIRADGRAKYSSVKQALDEIHSSGLQNVAFIVDQHNPDLLLP